MTRITLTVNGKLVRADVEPRTNLADFLREERLLTGTHIGCEHGICGACTVLVNGEIARSCINLAVACDGAEVRTIEDFDDDALMQRLRTAFSQEHALQCGYCTPGMLMAARDLVRRHEAIDTAGIRLEMSGNLCRCTGYVGMVRAIEDVMAQREKVGEIETVPALLGPAPGPGAASVSLPSEQAIKAARPAPQTGAAAAGLPTPSAKGAEVTIGEMRQEGGFTTFTQSFVVHYPRDEVWHFMADMEKVATCMPGVMLDGPVENGRLSGQMAVKLGPINVAFAGEGDVTTDESSYRSTIEGSGRDKLSASRAKGKVDYSLSEAEGGDATRVDVSIAYSLAGPLAQFSRSGLVRDIAGRLAGAFAQNLEARLSGKPGYEAAGETRLDAGSLLFSVLWARIRGLFARLFGKSGGA